VPELENNPLRRLLWLFLKVSCGIDAGTPAERERHHAVYAALLDRRPSMELRIREHLTVVNAEVVPRRKLRLVSPFVRTLMDRPASSDMNIMNTIDAITIVEGYDAMRIFLEAVWRRHGKTDEEIEFLVGGLKWTDGAPVDPTMWEGWLTAVQIACVGRTLEIAKS
jgi:hypothetical protein